MASMSDVGEKEFLRLLLPNLVVSPFFVNGFGHDASIVDVGLEKLVACKIDRAPFPVSLHRGIGDFRAWGRLAVVANISDLLSVGASPKALMLSLVLPESFDMDSAREIVFGCEEACIAHEIAFVGGDTKEGPSAQVVGSAWGTVSKGEHYGRQPANPGDYLFIAGRLGSFAGSIALIDSVGLGSAVSRRDLVDALTSPKARVLEGHYMRESKKVSAACDLSDGLAEAISIFCSQGAGITLSETSLPMHSLAREAAIALNVPLWRFAFGVGDWSIAFVVREKDARSLMMERPPHIELFQIGRFDASGQVLVKDQDGIRHHPPQLVNEHFRKRAEDDEGYLQALLSGR